jgi:hypothetical protein
MKVETLRVLISEDDINRFLPRAVPPDAGVENLRIHIAPEGILLLGDYPTFLLRMSFETRWEIAVAENRVQAKLAGVKVAGLPAKMLRGLLLKVIRDAAAKEPGIKVEGDSVLVDVGGMLKANRVPLEIHLTGAQCLTGQLLIEAGPTTTA